MIVRNPKVILRHLTGGEGAVLLDVETTNYFKVNEVGALIWERLETPSSVDEIIEHVALRVNDAPASLREDVESFLRELEEDGLVQTP